MSVTLFASGTTGQTSGGGESFPSSPNVPGSFELQLDLNLMAAGDVIEVRRWKMVAASGTTRVIDVTSFAGVQPTDGKIAIFDAVNNTLTDTNAVRFGITQTFGTTRALPYAVLNLLDYPTNFTLFSIDASGRVDVIKVAGTTQTAGDIIGDTNDIQARLPAALVSGRMDSSVGAMAANTLTASALDTTAVDEIVDQTWDELIAGHLSAGSTGAALNAAGGAGDPWITPLPGLYVAGTAGFIVGTNLDSQVSTVQSDTNDIQARLPAALTVDGNMKSDTLRVSGTVQTAGDIIADTNDIQARLPAALTGAGNIKSDALAIEGADPTDTIRDSILNDATRFAGANIDAAITSRAPAATALTSATWTNTRAGYIDNLNALKIKKNTALNAFPFLMVQSADHITPATGLAVTATRSLDGAAFAACANVVVEVANGVYKINLATTDLNGDTVTLKFTAAAADQRIVVIATEP